MVLLLALLNLFDGALPLVSLGYAATVVPQMVLDASPLKKELRVLDPKPPIGNLSIGLSSKTSKRDLPLVSLFFD